MILLKSLLLGLCAGTSLIGSVLIVSFVFLIRDQFFHDTSLNLTYRGFLDDFIQLYFIFIIIGSILCLIFGTPFLLLIDKYFGRFRFRYMVGAPISAWFAWLVIAGPLFITKPQETLFGFLYWTGWAAGHVMLYFCFGLATGTVFTLVLYAFDRYQKRCECHIFQQFLKIVFIIFITIERSLLLALCAALYLGGFILMALIFPSLYNNLMSIDIILRFFLLIFMGIIICLSFGTPFVLLIDKYFSPLRFLYIIVEPVASGMIWFISVSFVPDKLISPLEYWIGFCILIAMGFATGALFTLVLAALDRFKKRRVEKSILPFIKTEKSLLLALCAGLCFSSFLVTRAFINEINSSSVSSGDQNLLSLILWMIWNISGLLFSLTMVGGIFCLIFGTPFLLLIDRYFGRFWFRYMVGGPIIAYSFWLILSGFLSRSTWPEQKEWREIGFGHVMIYIAMGFAIGTLFTLVLALLDHCKQRRLRLAPSADQ